MAKIRVLEKGLAELIAAGEVVERPASIAKELIENAVDAGATSVNVEIQGGGIALLRVGDNGCGIAREDIRVAFLRHATSKISGRDDLDAIRTLGFRGEALASVAAMAKVELITKTADENEGTLYRIEGGEEVEFAPAGCPVGSVFSVRDVFYNTPARMKFLKKDVGEGNAVAGVVDKCALAYPDVAFKFTRDGKVRLQTSGGGELLPVIQAIYGSEFSAHCRFTEHETGQQGVRVSGYVTAPPGAKPSRAYQNFFLNGRYVRTRTAAAALEEAFKTYLPGGKFPGCVLHIELNHSLVDVNVHPAKIEVRFANERPIFQAVYFAAKNVISPNVISPGAAPKSEGLSQPNVGGGGPPSPITRQLTLAGQIQGRNHDTPPGRMSAEQFRALYSPKEKTPRGEWTAGSAWNSPLTLHAPTVAEVREQTKFGFDALNKAENPTNIITSRHPPRVIGELAGVYILLEREGELVIIDKHAAHERIIYERLKEQLVYGNRQILLSPIRASLAREEHAALMENPESLLALGFLAEDFGSNTVIVREVPIEMGERDIAFILGDIAGKLRAGNRELTPDAIDRLCFSIACKNALRARDKNTLPELEAVAEMLFENPHITHCPHGRPVLAVLGSAEIEKMFGRRQG